MESKHSFEKHTDDRRWPKQIMSVNDTRRTSTANHSIGMRVINGNKSICSPKKFYWRKLTTVSDAKQTKL